MKNEILHDQLVAAFRSKLPKGTNLAATLSEILFLGKEAIYRRLRGEVPFSFYEVSRISERMGISLDSIVGAGRSDEALFRLKQIRYHEPRDEDYRHYLNCVESLQAIEDDPRSELGSSTNTLPQNLLIPYENLARLCRFKWQYQHAYSEATIPFDQIAIPERLAEIEQRFVRGMDMIKNTTYIWDSLIFKYMVNNIDYFRRVNLITGDDVCRLKEELYRLIDHIELMASSGTNPLGNRVQIYISNTNFETAYTYVQGHSKKMSLIRVFTLNTASSFDEEIFESLRRWMLSLRRLSVLISESGEMYRVQFFRRQRELVDSL